LVSFGASIGAIAARSRLPRTAKSTMGSAKRHAVSRAATGWPETVARRSGMRSESGENSAPNESPLTSAGAPA
jgi:hypothetical protein